MSYTTEDFRYSILGGYDREDPLPSPPVRVLYAYGNVDSDSACCLDCGGEWDGGFVVELENGKFAHVTGWCDYTGWGCQDGAEHTICDSLDQIAVQSHWDKDPADLNQELPRILKENAEHET